jgi:uncharacterized damage-inducible protein DinB
MRGLGLMAIGISLGYLGGWRAERSVWEDGYHRGHCNRRTGILSMGNELAEALKGESAHTAPSHILEGLSDDVAHCEIAGAPHTIYQELWHIAFWLQMSLDWIGGVETPYPERATDPFPDKEQTARESWEELCQRFFRGIESAAAIALDAERLNVPVRCPSRPGEPVRTMTVQEQLESLVAHDAYHFGRIVLLRQLCGAWPPKSGGFTW